MQNFPETFMNWITDFALKSYKLIGMNSGDNFKSSISDKSLLCQTGEQISQKSLPLYGYRWARDSEIPEPLPPNQGKNAGRPLFWRSAKSGKSQEK